MGNPSPPFTPPARMTPHEHLAAALLAGEYEPPCAGLDRKVARLLAEEPAAVGVVEHDRQYDEDDDLAGPVSWSLAGDDGGLIADVFGEHERGADLAGTDPLSDVYRERGHTHSTVSGTQSGHTLDTVESGAECPRCGDHLDVGDASGREARTPAGREGVGISARRPPPH